MYDISFPNLGLYLKNIPDGFTIFGMEVKLYGIVIAFGFLLAYWIATRDAKRTGQDPELYLDYLLCMIVPAILCARIYYIVFSWDYYFVPGAGIGETILRLINIREGGLAIYGGIIGGAIVCVLFARKRKVSVLTMTDTILLGVPLAQAIGRLGNFFNREAFGDYTNSLLAMAIPLEYYEKKGTLFAFRFEGIITAEMMTNVVDGCIRVHPTFLYEALWNIALFAFLMFWRKRKKFDGEILALYLGGYGLGRFWIEGLRTDPLLIGQTNLRVSQLLAICLVAASVVFYLLRLRQYRRQSVETGGETQDIVEQESSDN